MKVALVHDWLIHMRGGEKVLEAFAEIYPDATIYTLFYDKKRLSPALQRMKIKASVLHSFPGIRYYYRWLLPFLPLAIKSMQVEAADLVLSSSHCVAKAIPIPEGAYHICYCHTPMRYLWGFEDVYFEKFPFLIRPLIKLILSRLRQWDKQNSQVDQFISNSENVRKRIQKCYDREAFVVHPPLDAGRFCPAGAPGDYYLVVSHFVPYKRLDLVIEAFNELADRQLLIVGSGPLKRAYRKIRKSENISFVGSVSDAELKQLYAGARALIFPTEEDFGIVPLEAQACGAPVIAYGKGGALESVRSGIFFENQTPEAIRQAVAEFEKMSFDRSVVAQSVLDFGKNHFKDRIRSFIEQVLQQNKKYASH